MMDDVPVMYPSLNPAIVDVPWLFRSFENAKGSELTLQQEEAAYKRSVGAKFLALFLRSSAF